MRGIAEISHGGHGKHGKPGRGTAERVEDAVSAGKTALAILDPVGLSSCYCLKDAARSADRAMPTFLS